MRTNQIGVDAVAHDVLKNSILLCGTEAIEASPIEIGDTRDEGKAERVAESEDEVADTATIDMVSDDVETGVGFQQSISCAAIHARRFFELLRYALEERRHEEQCQWYRGTETAFTRSRI